MLLTLNDFYYDLPRGRIAQTASRRRDHSRLMSINRKSGSISHHYFYELANILTEKHVLVFNNSKVEKARFYGKINETKVEILVLKRHVNNIWSALVRPGKKFTVGQSIQFIPNKKIKNKTLLSGKVIKINPDATRLIELNSFSCSLNKISDLYGHTPLPPYIKNFHGNYERYQTTYASKTGSIAAPTAGLHFSQKLLKELAEKGIDQSFITLHVGLGTFQEVRSETIENHLMHSEYFEISKSEIKKLNKAKTEEKKIIAVGTTSARVLETISNQKARLKNQYSGETDLFIYPGYKFKFIDGLITNFHLPKSTLLMLVSAFAGYDLIKRAYEIAIKEKYRFYSFGDAMLIE